MLPPARERGFPIEKTVTVETIYNASVETWKSSRNGPVRPTTAREVMEAAGLSWNVELVPAYAEGLPIPGSRAVLRSDRREPLAVVGQRYAPVQNTEAFAFFDQLVGAGKAVYETAGALDRGRRIWLQARLPEDVWVTDQDNVGKYLTLTNSHDGGSALRALFTPKRIVCKNTFLAVLRESGKTGVSIRHVGDVLGRAKEAERLLGISIKYFDAFGEQAQAFTRRGMLRQAAARYFEDLVPDPKDGDPARARKTRETLGRLFEAGKGNALPGVRGSLWAAVNAVTEFSDHERSTRLGEGDSAAEKRFESAHFGSGAQLKERAWSLALDLVS